MKTITKKIGNISIFDATLAICVLAKTCMIFGLI